MPRKPGRPTKYSKAIADLICQKLSEGKTLAVICGEDWAPSRSMINRWLLDHPEFRDEYKASREICIDALVDQTIQIADDAEPDDNANLVKTRISTRQWYASHLSHRYSDKTTTAFTGQDGEGPVRIDVAENPEGAEKVAKEILFALRLAGAAKKRAAPEPKAEPEKKPRPKRGTSRSAA